MKRITFYLDFVSPHARLAFEELPRALMGLSYAVRYRPLLLADIPDYPVIPMRLLCLAVASDPKGDPNRYVCESLFQHVWRTDADTDAHVHADAAILAQLHANGVEAMAHGISSVPAFELEGRIFCGLDSLPRLRACLEGNPPVHR
ncbi:MAG: hypothetical protein IPH35_13210 [Rhodoferax sp.]|nr:hypothetical protein [Rhodoferax sp.]